MNRATSDKVKVHLKTSLTHQKIDLSQLLKPEVQAMEVFTGFFNKRMSWCKSVKPILFRKVDTEYYLFQHNRKPFLESR